MIAYVCVLFTSELVHKGFLVGQGVAATGRQPVRNRQRHAQGDTDIPRPISEL